MTYNPILICLAFLSIAGAPSACQDETKPDKEVLHLLKQLRTAAETGKLPAGFRLVIQADLSKPADEDGPEKQLLEKWKFTESKLFRLKPNRRKGKVEFIIGEGKEFNTKKLATLLLKSQFQSIGLSDDEGPSILFAGTDYSLGDRSIEIFSNDREVLQIGESCVGANFSAKDSIRFGKLYKELVQLARKEPQSSNPRSVNKDRKK